MPPEESNRRLIWPSRHRVIGSSGPRGIGWFCGQWIRWLLNWSSGRCNCSCRHVN